ncbi:monocarboxylate transporter 2-like [Mizuhopecten yessoensis]|uniref:Monocarboxylate transporter 8 n=1 Tax=Mizuhopecten yessoensis TaxID=6573 RepID=A0A210QED7_MIZYE|nr:monocarboxylate transporter 2-like [Mizuhopecten yessoensis]OWF47127.1 Monocarboxylate transporter 8 [Mizuhopecten yessoensis]
MQASTPGEPQSADITRVSSSLYRHSSSESGTSSEGVKCIPFNPVTRESISGVSITMKTQPRKDGFDPDHKTTTRIDFGDFFPDGGWGWVVTGAATLVNILCNGFHYAFGTLYLCILEQKELKHRADAINTAWLGSVGVSITLFLSPIIATICQRKSPRLYAVIGGLICSLGCLFLAFSTEMDQLFISHCVVLSLGSGITLTSANIIVGRYFRRKRHLAEMIMISGTGLGAAVMSVLFRNLYKKLEWRVALQCLAGILVLTIFAGSLYRSASMYHPRRKVIVHIKSQKKGRRDQEDDNTVAYFDFSALRMRSLQALMCITGIVGLGIYVPFVVMIKTGSEHYDKDMLLLYNVYLGLGFLLGCLIHGYIVIRESKECVISTHHLCQSSCIACGLLTLLLIMAKDFNAFALYAWAFGIFCGGYHYTLKMYTYELVKLKIMERAWGFVAVGQCIPVLIGSPISLYLNRTYDTPKAGYIFSGVSMLLGGLLFFLMPMFEKHKSNQEIIQIAKNTCSKNSAEAAALLDLDLTEAMITKPLNNVQFIVSPSRLKQNGKDTGRIQMQCFIHHKEKERPRQILLSKITEEKEGLRLDFNEVSHASLSSKATDSSSSHSHRRDRFERSELSHSCAHTSEYPSDSTHSNHTGKSAQSESTSSRSGEHRGEHRSEHRKFKKSMDNVRIELFDPPSQEKESTATVSYDSDLYINLCEAQV